MLQIKKWSCPCALVLCCLVYVDLVQAETLIVWNVGQGQWVTLVNAESCLHFDVGGEFKPSSKKLREFCGAGGKENFLYFSHWDWDHIGLAKFLSSQLPRTCIAQMPGGEGSEAKMRLLKSFSNCKARDSKLKILSAHDGKTPNANSNVFVALGVLIPGDSPTSQEKLWSQKISKSIRTLILGHHGSRTSTGKDLLDRLPNLQVAIASARKKRYGHPHSQTLFRLQMHQIPVLRTEDWGTIVLPLEPTRGKP